MTELVVRIGFSLAVVLGLLWGLARVLRRPLGAYRGAGPVAVLDRHQLSRTAAVAVVRLGDRAIVLGVTDQQVNLLTETDLEAFEQARPQRRDQLKVGDYDVTLPPAHPVTAPRRLDGSLLAARTWTATLDFIRERTTRR